MGREANGKAKLIGPVINMQVRRTATRWLRPEAKTLSKARIIAAFASEVEGTLVKPIGLVIASGLKNLLTAGIKVEVDTRIEMIVCVCS